MRVNLTGTFAIEGANGRLGEAQLPTRQGRLLLAYLLVNHDRPIPREELAELLWGEQLPPTWAKSLTVAVSKLRATLTECGLDGAATLANAFGCYQLALPAGTWIDVEAAAALGTSAGAELDAGQHESAAATARAAAELASRPFLPGYSGEWVEQQRGELRATLLRALTCRAEAELAAGDARTAGKIATAAIAVEPFHEAGHQLLMRAHASDGNRAGALRAYERCRTLLADELGVDPDPQTEAVYLDILRASSSDAVAAVSAPSAAPVTAGPAPPPRSRRRWTWVPIGAAGLAGVVVVGLLVSAWDGGAPSHRSIPPNSLVGLDPRTGRSVDVVSVGARPGDVVATPTALWVANVGDGTISEIDRTTHALRRTVIVPGLSHLAAAGPTVWATTSAGAVDRIDPAFGRAVPIAHLGQDFYQQTPSRPIAVGLGSLWVVDPTGEVLRLDPNTGRRQASDVAGQDADAVAVGGDAAWVGNANDGTVSRIDSTNAVTATIPVGHGPAGIALLGGAAWVTNSYDGTVVRIDRPTNAPTATIGVGEGPSAIAVAGGAVWVANTRSESVSRIDAARNRVTMTVPLAATPGGFAYADGRLWVTAGPPARAITSGGVVHVNLSSDITSIDPARAEDLGASQIDYATCAKLLNYPDLPAPRGYVLAPEVAESVPQPSPDGRTYSFVVRPGFRFAPPSNEPVSAQTFADTIERVLNPALRSLGAAYVSDIVGAGAFAAGRTRHVSGLQVRGDTLTVRLVRRSPDFLARISTPFFCAVPSGTPVDPHSVDPIPSAGPYTVESYLPGRQIVLVRNSNYRGSRPRHFDKIVYTIGVGADESLADLKSGAADYTPDALPLSAYAHLDRRFGPASTAARHGRQRYFVNPSPGLRYLMLNTARPLFANAQLRRAVNYAIDRPALVAQQVRAFAATNYGGGSATSNYLPPGFPGYRPSAPYPLDGPDLATARRLAAGGHGVAQLYTCAESPCPQEAEIIQTNLAAIGIRVVIHAFPKPVMFTKINVPGTPYDIATVGWGMDYPDPSQYLTPLLDRSTIGRPNSTNWARFDDPHFEGQLHSAARQSGPERYVTFGALADAVARNSAPMVVYSADQVRDFFSARIGCQVYQPVYGMDLANLCLRPS